MSIVAIITRIMPDSPESDLELIEKETTRILKGKGARNISFTEEDVAFGLRAILAKFAWPEEKDTEIIEVSLASIEGVSSAKIEDYHRAFG